MSVPIGCRGDDCHHLSFRVTPVGVEVVARHGGVRHVSLHPWGELDAARLRMATEGPALDNHDGD